jgi:hypothetical protein
MISTETSEKACAFIEQYIARGPLATVTLADGSQVTGVVVEITARASLVIERPAVAGGESPRVEIDLVNASLLKVFVPGRSVKMFS